MVSSNSRDKLLQALRKVVERNRRDGTRLTVVEVAREAGVSRATANRDREVLAAFKRAAFEAAALEGVRARRGAASHRQLVTDLKRTINDMANIIQTLSVGYEKLQDEFGRLRAERSEGSVVPFRSRRRDGRC